MMFKAWNAYSHLSVQLNFFEPFSISKNGTQRSVAREMNLLNVATFPARLFTSLDFQGELMSKSTLIFSGLASIPS